MIKKVKFHDLLGDSVKRTSEAKTQDSKHNISFFANFTKWTDSSDMFMAY